ncbi:MAG TPA: DUF5946 family protein [Candidatus Polarisedimenticolaceae bacterium]|nr:DUF5946 family protein [Candidatus Polarisedimenticolaceae bacterium]
MSAPVVACPGCGLELPRTDPPYDRYYHASPECWSVYGEVLAREYQNAVLFGQVHQLTVDSYAVQHAGGPHPDKSVDVHLTGLHLVLVAGIAPPEVPPRLQRLVQAVTSWPHFAPPAERGPLTVFDVALADSPQQHAEQVRRWAAQLWEAWSPHHAAIAELASQR